MDRRSRYLQVALALFLERGFNGVSMDQLVAAAGGSKATLYRYFDSKEALFEAIIDDIAAPAVPASDEEDWSAVALDQGLRILGQATAAAALDQRTIHLMQLAIGEHARFPQLGQSLFERGPARTYARLRAFIAAKVKAGDIAVRDPQIAAEQFLGGIIGHQQMRMALGLPPPPQAEIAARIEAAVQAFIATYRTSGAGSADDDR